MTEHWHRCGECTRLPFSAPSTTFIILFKASLSQTCSCIMSHLKSARVSQLERRACAMWACTWDLWVKCVCVCVCRRTGNPATLRMGWGWRWGWGWGWRGWRWGARDDKQGRCLCMRLGEHLSPQAQTHSGSVGWGSTHTWRHTDQLVREREDVANKARRVCFFSAEEILTFYDSVFRLF